MPNEQTITVKTDEQNPEPLELIAKAIIDVSDAFDKINKSQLQRRTVVLLLHDLTKIPKGQIEKILDNAPKLKGWYTKEIQKAEKKK